MKAKVVNYCRRRLPRFDLRLTEFHNIVIAILHSQGRVASSARWQLALDAQAGLLLATGSRFLEQVEAGSVRTVGQGDR